MDCEIYPNELSERLNSTTEFLYTFIGGLIGLIVPEEVLVIHTTSGLDSFALYSVLVNLNLSLSIFTI